MNSENSWERYATAPNYWFTFVTHPEVELTNNMAERALREHVAQREIIGDI